MLSPTGGGMVNKRSYGAQDRARADRVLASLSSPVAGYDEFELSRELVPNARCPECGAAAEVDIQDLFGANMRQTTWRCIADGPRCRPTVRQEQLGPEPKDQLEAIPCSSCGQVYQRTSARGARTCPGCVAARKKAPRSERICEACNQPFEPPNGKQVRCNACKWDVTRPARSPEELAVDAAVTPEMLERAQEHRKSMPTGHRLCLTCIEPYPDPLGIGDCCPACLEAKGLLVPAEAQIAESIVGAAPLACPDCGETFKPVGTQVRCCKCRYAKLRAEEIARKAKLPERECYTCGQQFIPGRCSQVRCVACARLKPHERRALQEQRQQPGVGPLPSGSPADCIDCGMGFWAITGAKRCPGCAAEFARSKGNTPEQKVARRQAQDVAVARRAPAAPEQAAPAPYDWDAHFAALASGPISPEPEPALPEEPAAPDVEPITEWTNSATQILFPENDSQQATTSAFTPSNEEHTFDTEEEPMPTDARPSLRTCERHDCQKTVSGPSRQRFCSTTCANRDRWECRKAAAGNSPEIPDSSTPPPARLAPREAPAALAVPAPWGMPPETAPASLPAFVGALTYMSQLSISERNAVMASCSAMEARGEVA